MQATLTPYEVATSGFQDVDSVAFFRKQLGLQNFFAHRGGFILGGNLPRGSRYKKTVNRKSPPPGNLLTCAPLFISPPSCEALDTP